jgi:hypothetical protein
LAWRGVLRLARHVEPKLRAHIGYGIDDPLDGDVSPGLPVRNVTYFANLIWDVTKHLRLAAAVDYRRTESRLLNNNDGVGCQFQAQLKFEEQTDRTFLHRSVGTR